jgi:hypothetical protein
VAFTNKKQMDRFFKSLPVAIKMAITPILIFGVLLLFGLYTVMEMTSQKKDFSILRDTTRQIETLTAIRNKLMIANEGCYKLLTWASSGYNKSRLDSISNIIKNATNSLSDQLSGDIFLEKILPGAINHGF